MNKDRNQILLDSLKVDQTEIKWCFIANYYDGPISGLLHFEKAIYRFCCFEEDIPEQHVYVIQKLTLSELNRELEDKVKFENMVGTHNSFDENGQPLPKNTNATKQSAKQYYDEQTKFKNPSPWDQQVVAWFTL
ncbi:hypothetical protein [Candidatus Uabimicrobium sp. HlEnr_7]|uniref:hypothetical protein n=1 Tax=Candidatus Uabimicrobium helgolandensis TaxID=3095367 RepID=UPI00355669C7